MALKEPYKALRGLIRLFKAFILPQSLAAEIMTSLSGVQGEGDPLKIITERGDGLTGPLRAL